jgi:putative chitinase
MKINWTVAIVTGIIGLLLFSAGASAQSSNELETMIKLYLDSFTKSFGRPNQAQSESIAQIISSFLIYGDRDFRKLTYILATAWHESKLQLVKEKRATEGSDLYIIQQKYWNSGYYGRGFVQLTFKSNYVKMGNRIGIDLVNNPELALDRRYAADIIVLGMMEGLFTGVALINYINNVEDYVNARKVVNGLDRAELIAGHTASIIKNMEYQIT